MENGIAEEKGEKYMRESVEREKGIEIQRDK